MRYTFIALTLCLMTSCVSSSPDLRPSVAETTETAGDEQLSDNSMRLTSAALNINWNDGGIAFERLANGSIHGVNLASGDNFVFDAGKRDDESDNLANAALWINGVRISHTAAQVIADKDNIIWYKLTGYDNDTYYIVVDSNRLPEL